LAVRRDVDDWIARDVQRDGERRPLLQQMLERAPLQTDDQMRVLDVGAGYGVVTEEILRRFPLARVTLLDYSEPMFGHARASLAGHAAQLTLVLGDLRDASWTRAVSGPFDLAVSAIAIRRGAMFLDSDLVSFSGGLDAHLEWMREAEFEKVQCLHYQEPLAIIAATV
jgi:SAM-dependent methyltransferase